VAQVRPLVDPRYDQVGPLRQDAQQRQGHTVGRGAGRGIGFRPVWNGAWVTRSGLCIVLVCPAADQLWSGAKTVTRQAAPTPAAERRAPAR